MRFKRYGDMDIDELLVKKRRRKAKQGEMIRWNTIVSNLLHQSFFYLDSTERWMRILWELLPSGIMYLLLVRVFTSQHHIALLIITVVFVHVLNWILNNNFWNCMNCALPWLKNQGVEKTLLYLNAMRRRLEKHKQITGLMFLGSLCRFEWHDRSDIDVRILRAPGFLNGIIASFLISRERFLAFVYRQPLDVYLADSPEFLKRHRVDEKPIFTIRRDSRINDVDFPGQVVIELLPTTFNLSK